MIGFGSFNPHFLQFIEHLRDGLERVYYGVESPADAMNAAAEKYISEIGATEE